MSTTRPDDDDGDFAPPLYNEATPPRLTVTYALYRHVLHGAADAAPAAHYVVHDCTTQRWAYNVRVPKKREGWKAEVCAISEKDRMEPRYEVRREPLSRRFDFRPPNGVHSVMITSTFQTGSKSYAIEAPDGQRLVWRRKPGSMVAASLVSLPSNTILAEYRSTVSATSDALPRTVTIALQEATLCGTLEVTVFPNTDTQTVPLRRPPISRSSSSSSGSSDAGPRIHRAHRQPWLGICAPAVVAGAVASPLLCAAMNRNCIMGDELTNLGKASIKIIEERPAPDYASAVQAAYWAEQNRAASKNIDPRARAVDMDLLIASLIAVIAG